MAVGQTTGTLTSHKFQSGGIERSYKYYQPANLSSGAPLVFVLHGYGGTADPKRILSPINTDSPCVIRKANKIKKGKTAGMSAIHFRPI